ncbi:radical SAM mobile pair protein B [Olsenella uli]|uniref:radical SAM mobile pair protein B n=1 Tax=Olsenella uli TaxID=133926 RepID=UPI00044EB795|nr:radical SAM mobile pair protein B [Olsenella uli]EUB31131.1 radical SAM domain protein [Olsenella uli MSTE5]
MGPTVKVVQAKGIMTKSNLPIGGYSVNPYLGCTHACRYCYACFMKRFNRHDEPWGQFLDVKTWPAIKDPRRYAGQRVFIGSVTDPYLPQEEEFCRTRAVLEQLRGSGARISIATKSDLVLRDLDLIAEFPGARVSWSINTLDESFKDDMDSAPSIARRLAAMEAFHGAGVRTTCFISPIFPGITDVGAIIERAKGICNLVWLEDLNLRGSFKGDIMGYIVERHPDLLPLYQAIYNRRDRSYWDALDAEVRGLCDRLGLPYVVNDDSDERPLDAPPIVVNWFEHGKIRGATAKGAERAR